MEKDSKFQIIKTIYYAVTMPVMLFAISYFSISYNFELYNINIYFDFIKAVALYTFILDLIILVIAFFFKEKNTFSYTVERVGKFTVYILGIVLGFLFISVPFKLIGCVDLAGTAGTTLVWVIFINFYLLVAYLIAKKIE